MIAAFDIVIAVSSGVCLIGVIGMLWPASTKATGVPAFTVPEKYHCDLCGLADFRDVKEVGWLNAHPSCLSPLAEDPPWKKAVSPNRYELSADGGLSQEELNQLWSNAKKFGQSSSYDSWNGHRMRKRVVVDEESIATPKLGSVFETSVPILRAKTITEHDPDCPCWLFMEEIRSV